jgi:hypothetical protein
MWFLALAMNTCRAFVFTTLCLATIAVAAEQRHFDGKSWWRHIEVLAADDMEGRGIGTSGLERAQSYVIEQLKKLGLAPAGVRGFYQPIRFVTRELDEEGSSAAVVRDGNVEPLAPGEDFFFTTLTDSAATFEAPLVFIGYGQRIPETRHDDFAGLDLRGKVAVTMYGLPEGVQGPLAGHYQAMPERWKQLRAAGVIGWIQIQTPYAVWASVKTAYGGPTTSVVDGLFDETKGQRLMMWFNPANAHKLFAGTGHTIDELFALARARKALPRFALPVNIRATTRMLRKPVQSANIVAKLEGADPELRHQYVVLSAHLDGHGIGQPVNGDRIYNSAIDNAAGVAVLLDIAQALSKNDGRPRRSILFTFFTAHEGAAMHGSKYFVAHPTVDRKAIVADINIDNVPAVVPLKAVLILGESESELGDAARRVATSQNLEMDVDLEPQANRFTCCSDQGSFVMRGIPAVKVNVGFPGPLAATQKQWRQDRYHTPFDDLQQPINLETVAGYEEFVHAFALDVANNPRRPAWKANSFYRRYAVR